MLKRIRSESNIPGIIVDFSFCDSSGALNRLFTRKEICGILGVKHYRYVKYLLPFVAALTDQTCGGRNCLASVISIFYIETVNSIMERPSKLPWIHKEEIRSENVVPDFQGLVPKHLIRIKRLASSLRSFRQFVTSEKISGDRET